MIFRCPVCHTTVYELLSTDGEAGVRAPPRLYSCAGCTIVFADPARATRPGSGVPGQPSAGPDFSRVHTPKQAGATRSPPTTTPRRTRGRVR